MFDLLESKGLISSDDSKETDVPSHLSHWFSLFRLLNLTRRSGLNGIEPISLSDILSLSRIYPWIVGEHSIKCILIVDFEFRKVINDRRNK